MPDPIILGVGALSALVGILIGYAWARAHRPPLSYADVQVMPLILTPEMRYASWAAQYRCMGVSDTQADHLARLQCDDPGQRTIDQAAYAALLSAGASAVLSRGTRRG